jgi:hypothetical protein
MKISSKDFRVREGEEVNLKRWPTKVEPVYKSKEQYKKLLEEHVAQLSSRQQLLYASNRYALLLIFQAMDAAGKDGSISHVMSGVNPQGCQVFSFKHPSAAELQHDFLWRTTRDLPERGRIGIADALRPSPAVNCCRACDVGGAFLDPASSCTSSSAVEVRCSCLSRGTGFLTVRSRPLFYISDR